jgi:hypothetical protein
LLIQLFFKFMDLLTERRLRHMLALSCLRKAVFLRDRHEVPELMNLHRFGSSAGKPVLSKPLGSNSHSAPNTLLCVWTTPSRSAKSNLAMPSRNGRSPKINESPPAYSERPRPLTKREVEVVEWIAAGKRNREIGEILGCTSRTTL